MFYGTASSYIEFQNNGGLDTRFSITLMCWVQPGGQDGPLFSYGFNSYAPLSIKIYRGKLFNRMLIQSSPNSWYIRTITTTEVLPAGKWVHVAASYDYNSGDHSLYINGHLRASKNIVTGYSIDTASQRVQMGVDNFRNEHFKGKIAEMKVYDVALNEVQIQTSIRQGNCTFFSQIVFSLPSLMFPFINNTPVNGQLRKRTVTDTCFTISLRKTMSR